MAGKLIPLRELRARAKRAGMSVKGCAPLWTHNRQWAAAVSLSKCGDGPLDVGFGSQYIYVGGLGRTKRAAQIQARENTKKVLLCILTLEYGEPEEGE